MYLGIDLAFPHRPAGCAVLGDDASFCSVAMVTGDDAILDLARSSRVTLAAIDAPLTLPAGWHCLADPCECGACTTSDTVRRSSEVGLMSRGISVYWTTRRSFIKQMVLRAIELKASLLALGIAVIEIYPYASKRVLFGSPLPNKRRTAGRRFLQEHLSALIPGLSPGPPYHTHDELDALLAAYTGWLFANGRTEDIGMAADGAIVVPLAPQ